MLASLTPDELQIKMKLTKELNKKLINKQES